jgi:hypothetical protein
MAFIQIFARTPFINLFKTDYPTGVTATQVRDAVLGTMSISKSDDITEVATTTDPFVGFGSTEYTVKTIRASVIAYELDSETVSVSVGQISDNIDVYFVDNVSEPLDESPPVITPFFGTEIVINAGQFNSTTTFINTYFGLNDPQSGVNSFGLSPTPDWAFPRARGEIDVYATNGDGFTSELTFFLTINATAQQTPPTITGPSTITVYTDENLNNTTFIETKGFTITSVTGIAGISFSPSINWSVPATTITTITVVGGNNLTDTHQVSVTVATRPAVDTEAPQVLQTETILQFLKSAFPTSVPLATITTAIRNSFIVSDANDFTMVVAPTVVNFTTVGQRTYTVKFVDEFLNESPNFTIQVRYNDDSDLTAPTITGPATLTFVAGQGKTEVDVIAQYTLADNLDANPQWFNLTPQSFNTVGTYNYLLRAIDISGNIASRTIAITVVAPTSGQDTLPPIVNGPTSFRFVEADEITLADLIPFYTVTDNVSAREDITFIATLAGSAIASSYQFPLGTSTIILRFEDEAENFSLPLTVIIEIIDDEVELEINEDITKLNALTANHQYSGPIVSTLVDDEWQPISWLVDPVQVNYTIDGLSDEININFISKVKDTKINSGELVRVVYDSKSTNRLTWGLPTYDNKNRPTNHDIMLVDNGTMTKQGNQDFYKHSYKLVELIELLKEYRLPTLTFTSFTTSVRYDPVEDENTTYYAKPYNAFSILTRAIFQAFPNTTMETNELPSLIKIVDGQFLQNEMVGVDHQFEEATLYDVVTEIARIVNRTPVLYLNPNYGDVDTAKYLLFFEKDNEHTLDIVQKATLLARSTEYVESAVQGKGATQIVVDAKNMIGSQVSIFPSNDMYGFAQSITDDELDTVDKPLKIILPYNISSAEIVRFKKYVTRTNPDTDTPITTDPVGGYPEIITGEMPIYKYNEWLVLESDERENSAYYKEGENEVFFGKGVDDGTNDWEDFFTSASYDKRSVAGGLGVGFDEYKYILFQVEYFPLIDLEARVGSGKQATFNQVNPMVDSDTLGNEVVNYVKGNEDSDITISKLVYGYDEILKPTQLVDIDGEIYTVVSTSFNSGRTKNDTPRVSYKVAYQLNKQVRRNFTLNAPTEQRAYQVAYDNTFDRFNVIKENVKIHFTTNLRDDDAPILSDLNYLQNLTGGTGYRYILGAIDSANAYQTIELVAFSTFSAVFTDDDFSTQEAVIKYILAQPVKSLFGNSILVNYKMHNNNFAGTKLIIRDVANDSINFNQRQVSYTDQFGKVQRLLELVYIWQDNDSFTDIRNFVENYPQIEDNAKFVAMTPTSKTLAKVIDYRVDKDTRENLNVTLQVEYDGINGTKIGSEFVKYSGLYQTRPYTEVPFAVVRLKNDRYQPNDVVNDSDIAGLVATVDSIVPYYNNGYQVILDDDDYTFDTTSTYALVEKVGTAGISFVYKVLAIMGDRSSLVETDTVFIYY